jgi:predicted amino acid dehydrogenase
MKSFAFIVNPVTIKQLKNLRPLLKLVPDFLLAASLKNQPPFKVLHIKKIRSIREKEIEGYLIISPLISKQTERLDDGFILERNIAAIRLAESLNAGIIGLSGYSSLLTDKGHPIVKALKIPLTNGSSLAAWSVFEAIYRTARVKNVNLKESKLAVINASSPLGSLCSRKLSDYVRTIIINGAENEKLIRLKDNIAQLSPVEARIEEDMDKAVKEADIVVNADIALGPSFDIGKLKPNTIFCNISSFVNCLEKTNPRNDITVVEAGLIKLPYPDKLPINTGLPKNIIPASLAETMLLTFEEKFVSYSLGENINLDQLEEIADITVQHGFEVWVPQAPLL